MESLKLSPFSVLKVRDWLKFSKPDFEGFHNHVEIWEREGYPCNFKDMLKLAKSYNLPLPKKIVKGELVW